jgi:hypothetical protein
MDVDSAAGVVRGLQPNPTEADVLGQEIGATVLLLVRDDEDADHGLAGI